MTELMVAEEIANVATALYGIFWVLVAMLFFGR